MPVGVTIENVVKRFGAFVALKDVSVSIAPGELFFLLGPSGCGKTTLLRCIAGFHTPESGSIRIGARDVTALPPHKRDTGMMFQSYALWPHLTLAENVAFGLEMRKVPKPEIQRRVMEALDRVHLADRAKVKPNQLSGGQQQRVALARSLVIEPQCLLLDEPLSNLDAKLRLEMRTEIRRICKQAGLTAIYVTHDQKEALSVADRLAVMRDGIIEQVGTPEEVYRSPRNSFVAGFIGEGNFIGGVVKAAGAAQTVVETPCGAFTASHAPEGLAAGDAVDVCIRPEAVRFDRAGESQPNRFQGSYTESVYLGEVAQHLIALPESGGGVCAVKAFELNPLAGRDRAGERVEIWIPQEHVIVVRR
ncbi:MAG: ABC transporter ATP-binding protein [Kiritimatiellaeota bacterium]|nr:ABC transporter ATP-binding protein [Kiritimatiellota bacterium]